MSDKGTKLICIFVIGFQHKTKGAGSVFVHYFYSGPLLSLKIKVMEHKSNDMSKTTKKGEQIMRAAMRLKGYLDDNEQPTELAKGLLVGRGSKILLTPKGRKVMQEIVDNDNGLFALLGRLDLSKSTEELKQEVIKFGIWKESL